jgi:hypothetical protein
MINSWKEDKMNISTYSQHSTTTLLSLKTRSECIIGDLDGGAIDKKVALFEKVQQHELSLDGEHLWLELCLR